MADAGFLSGYASDDQISKSQSCPGLKMKIPTHRKVDASVFRKTRTIRIGLCCMEKKAGAKAMQTLLQRLNAFQEFEIVRFKNVTLLNDPPENWPECDCLIAFFSEGFPLEKAIRYCEIHPQMYVLNDLPKQRLLRCRLEVFNLLTRIGIPVPPHVAILREDRVDKDNVTKYVEGEDHIEVNGVILEKPFVEKPVSCEEHDICVYYHSRDGGGRRNLFRKIGDKASSMDPTENRIRTDRSYVYEKFIECDNDQDIKVYAIGVDYAHAESRIAPTAGRKVERTKHGREKRYAVRLSAAEHTYTSQIVRETGQTICGLDILRTPSGESYVCDVNGWASVKSKSEYGARCGRFLRFTFLNASLSRQLGLPVHTQQSQSLALSPIASPMVVRNPRDFSTGAVSPLPPSSESERMKYNADKKALHSRPFSSIPLAKRLCGQVAVFRHADRTPKQKVKFVTENDSICRLFGVEKKASRFSQIKWKGNAHFQELQELKEIIAKVLKVDLDKLAAAPLPIDEGAVMKLSAIEGEEWYREKMLSRKAILLSVLCNMDQGLKIQMKPLQAVNADEYAGHLDGKLSDYGEETEPTDADDIGRSEDGLLSVSSADVGAAEHSGWVVSKTLVICKWGGMLTLTGERQAVVMARWFRMSMFPTGSDKEVEYLLQDMQVLANKERRVIATATKFTQAFLHADDITLQEDDDDPFLEAEEGLPEASPELMLPPAPDLPPSQHLDASMPLPIRAASDTVSFGNFKPQSSSWTPAPGTSLEEHYGRQSGPSKEKGKERDHEKVDRERENRTHSAQFVTTNDYTESLLGDADSAKDLMEEMKVMIRKRSNSFFNDKWFNEPVYEAKMRTIAPHLTSSKWNVFRDSLLFEYDLICNLCNEIHELEERHLKQSSRPPTFYGGETLQSVKRRWFFLRKCLFDPSTKTIDTTKVPDVYDYVSYDVLHNTGAFKSLWPLYKAAKIVSNFVIWKECGVEPIHKLQIGQLVCGRLLAHICKSLRAVIDGSRKSMAHFYFTSETQIHSLLNLLTYSGLPQFRRVEDVHVNYLAHIVFRLYEIAEHSDERSEDGEFKYNIEVLFSPGVHRSTFSAATLDDLSPVFPMAAITVQDVSVEHLESICPFLTSVVS